MRPAPVLLALALFGLAGCGGGAVNPDPDTASDTDSPGAGPTTSSSAVSGKLTVSSPAFAEDAQIPVEYTCDGRNVPPPLRWRNVPPGTGSLAIVVDDPDAPAGLYVHWVVTGIPPATTEIVGGVLPATAAVSLNSANRAEYLGPCPPASSGVHHYRFKLYALSQSLTLVPATPATESTTMIADLSTAVTDTVGLFGR